MYYLCLSAIGRMFFREHLRIIKFSAERKLICRIRRVVRVVLDKQISLGVNRLNGIIISVSFLRSRLQPFFASTHELMAVAGLDRTLGAMTTFASAIHRIVIEHNGLESRFRTYNARDWSDRPLLVPKRTERVALIVSVASPVTNSRNEFAGFPQIVRT